MSKKPSTFRQSDVTRAAKAMEAAGHKVGSVTISLDDRSIHVHVWHGASDETQSPLEQWKANKNARPA